MRFSIALLILGSALADPGVSPPSVSQRADPGTSFNIPKTVSTARIPPVPDIVLLIDDTGSMGPALRHIEANLDTVISTVRGAQPSAQFAVTSFGDLQFPNPHAVNQTLTAGVGVLKTAVGSLTALGGGDVPEDFLHALFQIANGAITFRPDSTRIVVLIGDAPSHQNSGGITLRDALDALNDQRIRVVAVNVHKKLDELNQATAVTLGTGGVIVNTTADAVANAITSGLQSLDVTVEAQVSCDPGLSVVLKPDRAMGRSGADFSFQEVVVVAPDVEQGSTLRCNASFFLNGKPGGDAFVHTIDTTINRVSCFACDPQPGLNLCHPTTSCTPTPYGTMCLTRPGYKADGAADDDAKVQWRMKWARHEHRVAVKPGTSADKLCDPPNAGPNACKEVVAGNCPLELWPLPESGKPVPPPTAGSCPCSGGQKVFRDGDCSVQITINCPRG